MVMKLRHRGIVTVGPDNAARMRAMTVAEKAAVMEACLLSMADGETLAQWCIANGYAPNTVRFWFAADETWRQRYFAARAMQGQAFADEAIRVARESTNHSSACDRILIDTLKWAAAKAHPAEFGERQTVEHRAKNRMEILVVEEGDAPRGPLTSREAARIGGTEVAQLMPASVGSAPPADAGKKAKKPRTPKKTRTPD